MSHLSKFEVYVVLVVLVSAVGLIREIIKRNVKVTYHKPTDLGMAAFKKYIQDKEMK